VAPLGDSSAATAITVQESALAAAPSSESPASPPALVSQVDYIRAPAPQYPHLSRRLREQGLVVLKVLVDERGRAREIAIHRSSGFARLDAAACEAVSHAEFKPYTQSGAARATLVLVPIEFTLNQTFAQRG
jgi:protein TonB